MSGEIPNYPVIAVAVDYDLAIEIEAVLCALRAEFAGAFRAHEHWQSPPAVALSTLDELRPLTWKEFLDAHRDMRPKWASIWGTLIHCSRLEEQLRKKVLALPLVTPQDLMLRFAIQRYAAPPTKEMADTLRDLCTKLAIHSGRVSAVELLGEQAQS